MSKTKTPEYRPKPHPRTDIDLAWDMAHAEHEARERLADPEALAQVALRWAHNPRIAGHYYQIEDATQKINNGEFSLPQDHPFYADSYTEVDAVAVADFDRESGIEPKPVDITTLPAEMSQAISDRISNDVQLWANREVVDAPSRIEQAHVNQWKEEGAARARNIKGQQLRRRPLPGAYSKNNSR